MKKFLLAALVLPAFLAFSPRTELRHPHFEPADPGGKAPIMIIPVITDSMDLHEMANDEIVHQTPSSFLAAVEEFSNMPAYASQQRSLQ